MASWSHGQKEKVKGNVKETVGTVVGNERMEAEGKAQKLKGEAEVQTAKSQEYSKGLYEQSTGALKENIGWAVGNEQMEAEGKVTKLKGEARKSANK